MLKATDLDNPFTSEAALTFSIEGNIGVGKTTLLRQLQRDLETIPFNWIRRGKSIFYGEVVDEHLINLFYSDPKKYAFTFQWDILKSRIDQYDHMLANKYRKGIDSTFSDRSLFGDLMFTLLQVKHGNITTEEASIYLDKMGMDENEICFNRLPFKAFDRIVILYAAPHTCKLRIDERGRKFEKEITMAYLDKLDNMLFNLFVLNKPVREQLPVNVIISTDGGHAVNYMRPLLLTPPVSPPVYVDIDIKWPVTTLKLGKKREFVVYDVPAGTRMLEWCRLSNVSLEAAKLADNKYPMGYIKNK